MAKCPKCGKELNSRKQWSYWVFKVEDYSCDCGTKFRRYTKNGEHGFTLKLDKDGRFRKVK